MEYLLDVGVLEDKAIQHILKEKIVLICSSHQCLLEVSCLRFVLVCSAKESLMSSILHVGTARDSLLPTKHCNVAHESRQIQRAHW